MASFTSGIVIISLVIVTTRAMFCPASDRIPWIPDSGLNVGKPWRLAPFKECCDVVSPDIPFDAQVECPLCYNQTEGLPGYTYDPNNCDKFYSCVKHGDTWVAHHMTCPNCTFWDEHKLTCVQVDDSCLRSVSVATDPAVTARTQEQLMFCIDFEDKDLVGPGAYQPWVLNEDVTVVSSTSLGPCAEGSQCGYFNASHLVIPFFSNTYASFPSLRITFSYMRTVASPDTRGLISNDCFNDKEGQSGNSLYASCRNGAVRTGVKKPNVNLRTDAAMNVWVDVELRWDGENIEMITKYSGNTETDGPYDFKRPIRNSHCPLVIGGFIKDRVSSYFQGYMDNICFWKW